VKLKKKIINIIAITFFTGCVSQPVKDNGICNKEPQWAIKVPVAENKIYGVGIAGENINGESMQRKMAISRAIHEIASQMKTNVKGAILSIQQSSGYKNTKLYTFQTIDNQTVTAKIIKSCKNPSNGKFYVLMEAEK